MTTGNQPPAQQGVPKGARPGAMTMAMQAVQIPQLQGPKILRIGVIQGGKIVEERIIRKRESVFVGTSEKNHFTLQSQGPNAPARFELFQIVGNDYILNFTEAMRGRVGLPAGVQELAQLRSSGAARNAGTHWQVKLNDSSRGKVVIGDVTLLFQFVSMPPVQPRPQLPAAARGGFVKNIDWVFTAFIMFSFMTHFGFIIYLENADWPLDTGIGEMPESMAKMIFEEPAPPEEKPAEKDDAPSDAPAEEAQQEKPTKAAPAEHDQASAHADSAASAGEAQKQQAEAQARMVEEAGAAAEAMLLGALGQGQGAFADVLRGGAVVGNAADVLAQASGVGVATGGAGGTLRSRSGGGDGSGVGGLGGLAARGGPGATAQAGEGQTIVEVRVRSRMTFDAPEDEGGDGEFDPQVVVRQMRLRQGAVKACHERELRGNPTIAGKLTVKFTIQQSGSVSNLQVTENTTSSDSLGDCVKGVLSGLRFNPGPTGGAVSYSFPFVFAPQQ